MIRACLAVTLALVALPLAAADKADQTKVNAVAREVEGLQGSWLFKIKSKGIVDGVEKEISGEGKIIISSVGFHLFFRKDGEYQEFSKGLFKIDPTTAPKSIDFQPSVTGDMWGWQIKVKPKTGG